MSLDILFQCSVTPTVKPTIHVQVPCLKIPFSLTFSPADKWSLLADTDLCRQIAPSISAQHVCFPVSLILLSPCSRSSYVQIRSLQYNMQTHIIQCSASNNKDRNEAKHQLGTGETLVQPDKNNLKINSDKSAMKTHSFFFSKPGEVIYYSYAPSAQLKSLGISEEK